VPWALALAVPVAATLHGPAAPAAMAVALTYWTFLLAERPAGRIRRYNALGDYSYGVYIYAFPVQQTVMHLRPEAGPWENVALAVPPTLLLAVLSWHWVEAPALDRRRSAGAALTRLAGRLRGTPDRCPQDGPGGALD
jgi:peptidoglycan/LPS O-acetylase OafA/YrhL